MVTKKQLRELKNIDKNLNERKMRIEELTLKMLSPKISQISPMEIHGGAGSNNLDVLLTRKIELEAEYNIMLAKLYSMRLSVEQEIKRLNPDLQTIIHKRYYDGATWEAIADYMSYSIATIHRKHRQALIILSKSNNKDKRADEELMDNLFE